MPDNFDRGIVVGFYVIKGKRAKFDIAGTTNQKIGTDVLQLFGITANERENDFLSCEKTREGDGNRILSYQFFAYDLARQVSWRGCYILGARRCPLGAVLSWASCTPRQTASRTSPLEPLPQST